MKTSLLPTKIEALEYTETCGDTRVGEGIVLLDEGQRVITKLTQWTIREKKIALLWQASPLLLKWAKEACETERAYYDNHDDIDAPSWLSELEAAVKYAEDGTPPEPSSNQTDK